MNNSCAVWSTSPDFNPYLGYVLWENLKDTVYFKTYNKLQDPSRYITVTLNNLNANVLQNVQMYLDRGGGHFKHLYYRRYNFCFLMCILLNGINNIQYYRILSIT